MFYCVFINIIALILMTKIYLDTLCLVTNAGFFESLNNNPIVSETTDIVNS